MQAGDGNDTVVVYNVCELVSGELLDGGPGTDRLITPLSASQLAARGISVVGFEQVTVDATQSYLSECF